ncbi:hypothetical protein N9Q89_07390, partial [Flavobacteriaceae bacterium]|nr:hypothetical protein [Flavobacteriaceae bacterium]
MALTFNFASAQTEIDGTTNLRTTTTTTYAAGPITIVTSGAAINQEGVTFNLQATVTPNNAANDGSAFIESSATNRWGVDNVLIDGPNGESVIVTDISIVDFNANGTGYTEAAISNLHFEGITFRGATNTADNPRITVNGASAPGTFDVGQLAQNQYVEFGVEFMNVPGDTFTVGGTEDVTSVTLTNATTAGADSFQV